MAIVLVPDAFCVILKVGYLTIYSNKYNETGAPINKDLANNLRKVSEK